MWWMLATALVGCGPADKLRVDDGVYFALAPDGQATHAIVHLHGHGGDAGGLATSDEWIDVVAERGVVAAFPQGEGDGNWKVGHHVADIERDDRTFLAAVAADVVDRYGVQTVTLSGSSEGAAMVYDMLCAGPAAFDAWAPTAGSFWDEIPDICVNGTADATWPLSGQDMSIGVQTSPVDAVGALTAWWGCDGEPAAVDDAIASCEVWACGAGPVELCLHPGGHGMPDGSQAALVDWIEALPR
jgi:polyhydroxybutyrate depolymerase